MRDLARAAHRSRWPPSAIAAARLALRPSCAACPAAHRPGPQRSLARVGELVERGCHRVRRLASRFFWRPEALGLCASAWPSACSRLGFSRFLRRPASSVRPRAGSAWLARFWLGFGASARLFRRGLGCGLAARLGSGLRRCLPVRRLRRLRLGLGSRRGGSGFGASRLRRRAAPSASLRRIGRCSGLISW